MVAVSHASDQDIGFGKLHGTGGPGALSPGIGIGSPD